MPSNSYRSVRRAPRKPDPTIDSPSRRRIASALGAMQDADEEGPQTITITMTGEVVEVPLEMDPRYFVTPTRSRFLRHLREALAAERATDEASEATR